MKNSADQGGCYPQRLKAEVDNIFKICRILHILRKLNSMIALLFIRFAISLLVFLLTKNNTTSSPGFLSQRFNNLQRTVLLTSF